MKNSMPPISSNGGLTGQVTQYGYANDKTPDYNSNVLKIGNHDNPLTAHAAALTDSMAQQLGAKPGDAIRLAGGRVVYYADRAPESNARVDLYEPQGFDKSVADHQGVVNLGGGSPRLKGQALADAGESNALHYLGNSKPSAPMQQPAIIQAAAAQNSAQSPMPNMPVSGLNLAPAPSMTQNAPHMQPSVNQIDAFPAPNYALGRLFASHPLIASLMGMNNPNQSVD